MEHYACNFHGHCEVDDEGAFDTQELCEHQCEGSEQVDTQYTLAEALHLAPSDQVEVVRRLTGITVPRGRVRRAVRGLVALEEGDPRSFGLLEFHPYLQSRIAAFDRPAVLEALVVDATLGSVLGVDLEMTSRVEEPDGLYTPKPARPDDYTSYLQRIAKSASTRLDFPVLEQLYDLMIITPLFPMTSMGARSSTSAWRIGTSLIPTLLMTF
jgi:hypothetical protein